MAATKIVKKKGHARKKSPRTNHRPAKRVAPRAIFRPEDTLPSLRKYMLVDGFDIVVDLKRSKGSYIVDAKDGKRYLDFFTFVA
jgi:4-aminobutyrate aminotransferase-like enzyme